MEKIMETVRTRFAPSPTGYLHIGGLRTALYAFLFARQKGGKFVLRIEDTDMERKVDDAEEIIYRTLKDAGLNYDEGPDVGGEYAPYIQSERKAIYLPLAERLVENGGAYYCFCTKERLAKLHEEGHTKYDKHCKSLSKEEVARRIASGESYVIRQDIPLTGTTKYTDLVFGEIVVDCKDLEDGILIKSDGYPTYNFANVVDDYLMKINYVIRGTEYLSSTPKYNLIYEGLGWEKPNYIHLQPIMKDAQRKLSKRYGDASYEDYIKRGFLKEAIINYIALLGWSSKSNKEKFTLDEMIQEFSLEGLSKSSSIFDEEKLKWLNSQYIKELSLEEFHSRAIPFYEAIDYIAGMDWELLSRLLQSRIDAFEDIKKQTSFLQVKDFDNALYINLKQKTTVEMAGEILPKLLGEISSSPVLPSFEALTAFAEASGYKKTQVFWIYRIALTGELVTPGGATDMAQLLGRERVIDKLTTAIAKIK